MTEKPAPNPFIKLAIDFGPVLVFFAAYKLSDDIATATIAIAVAAAVAMVASKLLLGSVSLALILTSGLAIVFGGLTLAFDDERFLKIRPTIVNLLFAATLFLGLALRRPFLKAVFGAGFPALADTGWHKLSRNFALFFLFSAGLNEAIWRSFTTDTWVNFNVWGDILLTFAFTASQLPLINRYTLDVDPPVVTPPPTG